MRPGSVHDLKSYLDLGWAVADVVVIVITDRVTDAALAERFNCRQCDLGGGGGCAGGEFKHFKYRNIVAPSGGVLLEARCTCEGCHRDRRIALLAGATVCARGQLSRVPWSEGRGETICQFPKH